MRSAVSDPVVATLVPAEQSLHDVQATAFAAALKLPGVQAAQVRSCESPPALVTEVPGAQVAQAVQVAEFTAALYSPEPQGLQVRSAIALPCVATEVPAGHVDQATHAVAPLLSWSQVPVAQATGGASPPAQ